MTAAMLSRARRVSERVSQSTVVIFANAASLVSTTLLTSLLGVGYWYVAARRFDPHAVGVASAAISAMTLLAGLASLGLGTFLVGELQRQRDRAAALITSAAAVAALLGLVIGVGYALLAPVISGDLASLATWVGAPLFAAGVAVSAVAMVADQATIGLLRARWQLARNLVFGVAKLLLLVGAGFLVGGVGGSGLAIYATWPVGGALSLLWLGARVLRRTGGLDRHALLPRPRLILDQRHAVVGHQALNLSRRVTLLLPTVVVAVESASYSASFYIAWMIAGFAFMVPTSLTSVLYALGSATPEEVSEKVRTTLRFCFGVGVLATVGFLLLAPTVLEVFGSTYAEQATGTLRLLGLAIFGTTIKDHYVAIVRLQRRMRQALPLLWGGAVAELALATVGGIYGGLVGLTSGWLLAVTLEAALMTPAVLRVARPRSREAAPV